MRTILLAIVTCIYFGQQTFGDPFKAIKLGYKCAELVIKNRGTLDEFPTVYNRFKDVIQKIYRKGSGVIDLNQASYAKLVENATIGEHYCLMKVMEKPELRPCFNGTDPGIGSSPASPDDERSVRIVLKCTVDLALRNPYKPYYQKIEKQFQNYTETENNWHDWVRGEEALRKKMKTDKNFALCIMGQYDKYLGNATRYPAIKKAVHCTWLVVKHYGTDLSTLFQYFRQLMFKLSNLKVDLHYITKEKHWFVFNDTGAALNYAFPFAAYKPELRACLNGGQISPSRNPANSNDERHAELVFNCVAETAEQHPLSSFVRTIAANFKLFFKGIQYFEYWKKATAAITDLVMSDPRFGYCILKVLKSG